MDNESISFKTMYDLWSKKGAVLNGTEGKEGKENQGEKQGQRSQEIESTYMKISCR